MKSRKFIDKVVVYAVSGKGGNGSASFRREKFIPNGGPDGGDGGRGGNVIMRGDYDEDSLIKLFFAPHQKAKHGGDGRGRQMHGASGADLILKVPLGTEVWDREADVMLGDIVEHGQEIVVAKGGQGGLGNMHFKSSTNQSPTKTIPGGDFEEITLRLELKIMADIGLVGFPNAGKSSLLSCLSDAHPKVASYPFTTLNPILGTILFDDYSRLRIADIPGLIEGAHDGIGLGHAFLRHVERSKFLLYVIDMAGVDTRKPEDDYNCLRDELRLHDASLMERPSMVIANKMDLPEFEENLKIFRKETGCDPICISAETGEGIDELKAKIHDLCGKARLS
jgi:GTP-binding protein